MALHSKCPYPGRRLPSQPGSLGPPIGRRDQSIAFHAVHWRHADALGAVGSAGNHGRSPSRSRASVPAAMSQALQGIKAAVVTVADIADRVATVIGEKLKALQEFLSENLKKLRAQIFKLNILKSLKSIWNFPKAFKEEWLPSAIEKFKRRIFSFLNPVSTEPEYDSDASS
jgi:hypothetical protein